MWEKELLNTAMFESLQEEDVRSVIEMSREVRLKDKEILFHEGDEKHSFYAIGEGTMLISKLTEDGDESLINVLGKGEVFPHAGLFDKTPYPGTAQAKKQVRVLAIPVQGLEELIYNRPEMAIRMIQVLNHKLHYLQKKLNEVLSLDVSSRLHSAFSHLYDVQGKRIDLTHQEIGNIIGATRETVSRQLKKWERAGWLEVRKDCVEIIDEEKFQP
ncbi:Crp/Fnr family transcriptional regulator [Salisediminibacterium halotolerans]|uniref:CRP/FNR family transcriptional regulator, anaerobic regulatory protein n=1 Tax=Salisediminibacterium halotolerans TaxID=517425 RepID=A0A1H9P7S5_9BACI|nr:MULTISPECIES: Crp/Fnr family transcriptional regulator [Salisediminibacterium]RLJ77979.1 CRP/FNR family transcriptional regulator [Actinophytocola xinjiangensis]RPE88683.1 CRP/FNR family transcriptional regulator [Salisediminibacterium halotolerans]TWG36956.1 CRP/FNR family transcriptional regulator [Salisediminibacterium halotolerans]SER43829.1 CRP/FNR family transcriptional regulator, anaerobic regulatory protein [Salisediminibacterium haloalkalitolerans]GEL08431.1 transcriptional regulat